MNLIMSQVTTLTLKLSEYGNCLSHATRMQILCGLK